MNIRKNPHVRPPILTWEIPKVVIMGVIWGLGTPREDVPDYDRPEEYIARFGALMVCLVVAGGFFAACFQFPGITLGAVSMVLLFDLVRSAVFLYFGDYYDEDEDNA